VKKSLWVAVAAAPLDVRKAFRLSGKRPSLNTLVLTVVYGKASGLGLKWGSVFGTLSPERADHRRWREWLGRFANSTFT
jgi:hypothetical protein